MYILCSFASSLCKGHLICLLNHRYPYNNFLHHHVENIIVSCLEGKRTELVDHVINECDIVGKILSADKLSSLSTESNGVSYIYAITALTSYYQECPITLSLFCVQPTVPSEGKTPSKIGNVGHMTRIANKLIQLGNSNSTIQTHLQVSFRFAHLRNTV